MSIKIEGDGNKENVFSDSDSGMPLWNGVQFGLLPPDLSKAQEVELSDYKGNFYSFTVPENGWILHFYIVAEEKTAFIKIDGFGSIDTTPGQLHIKSRPSFFYDNIDIHCPYPVKKGQIITVDLAEEKIPSKITFAPCMSI